MALGWRLRRFRLGLWALLCLPGGSLQGKRVRQLCPGLCAGPCDGEASPRGAPSGFDPHWGILSSSAPGKAAGKGWFLKSTRLGQGPLLTHSWDPAHTYCPAVTLSRPTSPLLGTGTCSSNYRLNGLVEIPNFVF